MHSKQHISIIPNLLKQKGVRQIVISPGSRNAPLIKLFFEVFADNCFSIVDERSAAFFALGLALKSQKPVVVLSTSGTAVLNFAPAMAEAFYQSVPLIAVTADRPAEWIDQQDNQTIRQKYSFSNFSKLSAELPVVCTTEEDIWYTNRLVNEAFNVSVTGKQGPVHINVPLREPLYEEIPSTDYNREIKISKPSAITLSGDLIEKYTNNTRILIVCGQYQPDAELSELINGIADTGKAVVIAEPISNIKGNKIIDRPDLLLAALGNELEKQAPGLVIYFGGQVISKRLKSFLRNLRNTEFWFVDPSSAHIDTFKNLSCIVPFSPQSFFKRLIEISNTGYQTGFDKSWQESYSLFKARFDSLLPVVEYSDLKIFQQLSGLISENEILFAGNSSVIRYIQMFECNAKWVFSNRGTSGIDGCLSTASGIAKNSGELVFAILGDLSFVYDSNGLWNKNYPQNLKIIVVNNAGGGIFGMLEGPSKQNFYSEYLVAHHPVDISKLCGAFGVAHYSYDGIGLLEPVFEQFKDNPNPSLLEIKTPTDRNPEIFRNFIKNISRG